MTRTRVFAIAVIVITWASELWGLRAPDRSAVLAALEQRALTGMPRHLDHDAGQELQDAVTAALAANPSDAEMAWAAVRASFAVVADASPIIFDSMPTVGVAPVPPLKLPWAITADVTIDASADGSEWRHVADHASGTTAIPIARLFRTAARPGFHAVRLRATLRFKGGPGFLPTSDTRELPVVTYGISGPSAAGQRVAALLSSAARASASDFDRGLPQVPFGIWLGTVARTPDSPPLYWAALWCEARTGLDDEPAASICARATVGETPDGGVAEVWVKIATVDTSGAKPTWTTVTPTLAGIDLIRGARASGDLATLPTALRSMTNQWPHAEMELDARSITVSPAAPQPGEPAAIAIDVKNPGTSDLFGVVIDVAVGDAVDGPGLAHRQFVRSIPAGESATVKMDVRFPRGYGVVSVLAVTSAHGDFPSLLTDESNSARVANFLVRPDLAPPAFFNRVRAAIGTPR